MKKIETKGRSRKQKCLLFHRGVSQMKRFLAVFLSASMISTSLGSTTVLAAEAPMLDKEEIQEENPNFILDKEELSQALLKASKGKSVKEDAFTFQGEEAANYETLFQADGSLYELHPDMKKPDGKVNLKIYARLDGKEEGEPYTITGKEEILFLFSNRSSDSESAYVEENGKVSSKISILSSKELKKQIQEEETGAETDGQGTDAEKENSPTESDVKNEKTEDADSEKASEPEKEQEKKEEAQSPEENGASGAENSDIQNPSSEKPESVEKGDPDKAEESGKEEASNSEKETEKNLTEKEENPDANEEASGSEKTGELEQEKTDSLQVTKSEHFQMFLTAVASPSEMEAEEESDDESASESQVEIIQEEDPDLLQGDIYESVLLKNTAVAAFATTAEELGLSGSEEDVVYKADTESAILTLTVPAGAFEEKVKLKAEEIKNDTETHQELSDKIEEEGYHPTLFTAFDVKFVNADGEEVEPSEEVKVSIQFKKNADIADFEENLEETKILHLHEDVLTELSDLDIQKASLMFGISEFSIIMALSETPTGVAEVNGEGYDTLPAAFAAAGEGDTVKVLKNCELSEAIQAEKNLTLDLNGKVVKVKIAQETGAEKASGDEKTVSAFTVSAEKTFTIQNGLLGGSGTGADNRAIESNEGNVVLNEVIVAGFAASTGNGGVILLHGGTLEADQCHFGYYTKEDNNFKSYSGKGNSARNGGAIYAEKAAVTIQNSKLFYNSSEDKTGATQQYWYGGGALYADRGSVELTGNYFFYNRSYDYGAAVHLDTVDTANLAGNRIRTSEVYNHRIDAGGSRGGDGGGIYSRLSKTVTLTKNTIENSYSMGNGAGLYVLGAADCVLTLEENNLTGNQAGNRGGGMKLDMDKNSQVNLSGGRISGNSSSSFGGGIDYTNHDNPVLHLSNVMVTGNKAVRGAGIWSCPTSETEINSTLGGAFYNNKASGTISGLNGSYAASGDEIRYEGIDTPDKFSIQSNPPSATTHMSVSKRSLGGGVISWYSDEAESRYQPGNQEAEEAIYTNTNLSFGLHGELSSDHQKLAAAEAQLIIENNTSKRGGGIATNSPIVIGMENADVAVEVTKKWTEEVHPDSVYVDLYRIGDTSGKKVKLDSHVELNEATNWSALFEDLPSRCVTDGEVEDCHYAVEEQTVTGWKESSSTEYDKENKMYRITLTNAPVQYGSLTVSKEVTGSGDKEKAFTFRVTLSGEEIQDGTYGDMEFVDHVATFTLKHGESKSAAGLPEGTAYTVEELDNEGYTVTKSGESGIIVGGESMLAKFINAMGSGDNPTPTPDPKPTPDNGGGGNGGGGGRSHGGGSSSGSKKTTSGPGPATQAEEPAIPEIPEEQPAVPTEGLPKTGDSDYMDVPMVLLTVGMMAAAYVLLTGRKKTEE